MQYNTFSRQYEDVELSKLHQVNMCMISGVQHAKVTRFDGTVVAEYIGTAYLDGNNPESAREWAKREIISDYDRMEAMMRPEVTECHTLQRMINEMESRFGSVKLENKGDKWAQIHLSKWRDKNGNTPYIFFSDVEYAVNVYVRCGSYRFTPHRDSGLCSEGSNLPKIVEWVTENLASCERDGTITRIEL